MAKTKKEESGVETAAWEDVSIGDQVKHPIWGTGTVLFRSGSGDSAKAIVVFSEEGQKKLMLKYANLKKIGSAPKSEQAKLRAAAAEKPIMADPDVEAEELLPASVEMEDLGDAEGIFPDEEEEFGKKDAGYTE